MLEKKIQFIAQKDYVNLKEDYPKPIKYNLPDWYKKLEHSLSNLTIKGCMPFLDTLTSGYLLRIPQDIAFTHNTLNTEGKPDIKWHSLNIDENYLRSKSINLGKKTPDIHPIEQIKGSPLVEKNKNLPILKIINPWIIKTPPGYSCLFVPPLNNTDDRFSIIPGIVDTDSYPNEINFPFIVNSDKYPSLETTLKKGTPYVQIIPFKRDSWKMEIKEKDTESLKKDKAFYFLKLINIYKDKFWHKKKWS